MASVVLVTGVSRYLGGLLARRLSADPSVDTRHRGRRHPARRTTSVEVEFVRADIRNPMIGRVIESAGVDTVVHMNVIATPTFVGGRTPQKEINVIGTMQLLAACQKSSTVQRLVVKSSAAVYGSTPRDPAMFTEDMSAKRTPVRGLRQGLHRGRGLRARVRPAPPRHRDPHPALRQHRRAAHPHLDHRLLQPARHPGAARLRRPHAVHPRGRRHRRPGARRDQGDATGVVNLAGDGVVTVLQAAVDRRPPVRLPCRCRPPGLVGGLGRRMGLADFSPDQMSFLAFGRGSTPTGCAECSASSRGSPRAVRSRTSPAPSARPCPPSAAVGDAVERGRRHRDPGRAAHPRHREGTLMAARQGALAAGAARASGERPSAAPRRSSAPSRSCSPTRRPPRMPWPRRPRPGAPPPRRRTKNAARRSRAPRRAGPVSRAEVVGIDGGRGRATKAAPKTPTTPATAATAGEPTASEPVGERHRQRAAAAPPAPRRCARRRRASAIPAGRRATRGPRAPTAPPRRPRPTGVRVDPREKARRDAERPHLRIAEPPLDPTVHAAPGRTGLPLPDVGDALDAVVGMLRLGAQASGVAPDDVERRVAQVLAFMRRRIDGDYAVDEFGYDERLHRERLLPDAPPDLPALVPGRGARHREHPRASGGALIV